MMRLQLMLVVAAAIVMTTTTAEARGGRRGMYQQNYTPYYNNYNYNTTPTYSNAVPAATTSPTVTSTAPTVPASGIVQANAVAPATGVVQASGTAPASVANGAPVANSNGSVVGSAQWKAEQSARMGSVAHIGGGFGGGSFEGNGFGATPEQAIQNSCYWGQRTPIEIGVARGANGYYATIFYR